MNRRMSSPIIKKYKKLKSKIESQGKNVVVGGNADIQSTGKGERVCRQLLTALVTMLLLGGSVLSLTFARTAQKKHQLEYPASTCGDGRAVLLPVGREDEPVPGALLAEQLPAPRLQGTASFCPGGGRAGSGS